MRIESEAFLDGATGRWYGVIRLVNDDGSTDTIYKTEETYRNRSKAEQVVVKKMQELLEG